MPENPSWRVFFSLLLHLNAWPFRESKKIHVLSEVDRYLLKPLVRGFSKVV